jgi:hypothetical protein
MMVASVMSTPGYETKNSEVIQSVVKINITTIMSINMAIKQGEPTNKQSSVLLIAKQKGPTRFPVISANRKKCRHAP